MIHLIQHIHWRYSPRIKAIIIIFVLYLIAGLVSSFDFSGRTSNIFCGFLTVGISIAFFVVAFMAYKLAKKIEYSDKWLCVCCCRDSSKIVLLGYILLSVILGSLKLWSAVGLFAFHWGELPLDYHAQSWAYLVSNAMEVVMVLCVLEIFESKYKCAQKERVFTQDIKRTNECRAK